MWELSFLAIMESLSEKLKKVVAILREWKNFHSNELEFLKAHLPDSIKQPITSAVVQAYMARLETAIATISALPDDLTKISIEVPKRHSLIQEEIEEIGTWIKRTRRPGHEEVTDEEIRTKTLTFGDALVSKGFSFSEASLLLEEAKRQRIKLGAPPVSRAETLQAYDMQVAKGLSHAALTRKVCDCDKAQHGKQCEDRLRKRIYELKKFLQKYDINIPSEKRK
jgi:hypothetical protein